MKFLRVALAALLIQLISHASDIHSKNRTIDANRDRTATALPSIKGQDSHWILQFEDSPGAGLRLELARRGVRVLEYVPDSAVMASFHQTPGLTGLKIAGTGQLTAAGRTAPGLETAPAYLVVFHGDVLGADAKRLLEGFQTATMWARQLWA
jgi:hypothetical protein